MMTRKHFKQFAEVIKDNTTIQMASSHEKECEVIKKEVLINNLSLIFMRDNSNFNKSKFIDACNERGEG